MIETIPITSRELVRRLKKLVDFVSDSDNRIIDPQKYALNYARLVHLGAEYRDRLDTPYVKHNLTDRRYSYILRTLGEFEAK
jgi:hypothetical protein